MLQRGDMIAHFEVNTLDGQRFGYSSIWQQKNLLLVVIPRPESDSIATYVTTLNARITELHDQKLEVVITRDPIPGTSASAVVVADKWGEIVFAMEKADVRDLPPADDLIEWVTYLNHQCPECEGEAR